MTCLQLVRCVAKHDAAKSAEYENGVKEDSWGTSRRRLAPGPIRDGSECPHWAISGHSVHFDLSHWFLSQSVLQADSVSTRTLRYLSARL